MHSQYYKQINQYKLYQIIPLRHLSPLPFALILLQATPLFFLTLFSNYQSFLRTFILSHLETVTKRKFLYLANTWIFTGRLSKSKISASIILIKNMFAKRRVKKSAQSLSKSCIFNSSFSLAKVLNQDTHKELKRGRKKQPRKTRKSSKCKEKTERTGSKKSKSKSSKSSGRSSKKQRNGLDSPQKKRKTQNKINQKVAINSHKQYKTFDLKSTQKKHKKLKDQKNTASIKTSTSSTFKKPELNLRKRMSQDENNTSPQKKTKPQYQKKKEELLKQQADMDRITLSQIAANVHKIGNKQLKVIHEYFGVEDKLSLVYDNKDHSVKKRKNKLQKSKTKSTQSSYSQRKGRKSHKNKH